MSDLYRVSGKVTADDGTAYAPMFFGDFWQACRVRDAIVDGARDRGDVYHVRIDRHDDQTGRLFFVGSVTGPEPARRPDRAPFEVIGGDAWAT